MQLKITLSRAHQLQYECDLSTDLYNMLTVMMPGVPCLLEGIHGLK